MKRIFCFLLAVAVLLSSLTVALAAEAQNQTLSGLFSRIFSDKKEQDPYTTHSTDMLGEEEDLSATDEIEIVNEPAALELEEEETTPLETTAQQWIFGFLNAAGDAGLTLDEGFTYQPAIYTGQHSYDLLIEQTPAYALSMSVLSDDGVFITWCSMRLVTGEISSAELVQACDTLWRAIQAMIAASDTEAREEEIEAICLLLCPDLPAALLRGQPTDTTVALHGISYSLWADFVIEAFYDDSAIPRDGYVVDFIVRGGELEGASLIGEDTVWEMSQDTLDWYAAFERAAQELGLALSNGFIYHEEIPPYGIGLDVYGELEVAEDLVVRVTLDEALAPYDVDVVLDASEKPVQTLDPFCDQFMLAVRASMKAIDPQITEEESDALAGQLWLRIGDRIAWGDMSTKRAALRDVAYELTVDAEAMRAVFHAEPAIAW